MGVPEAGKLVGDFRLERELGAGAFGSVWLAVEHRTGAPVAMKFLAASGAAAKVRFDRELEALSKLDHPNIVGVRGSGHWNGRAYIALEFVDGQPLNHWLREPQTLEAKRAVGHQLTEALEFAHRHGVVHRDLKPANIIVEAGVTPTIKVVDFGIAKFREAQQSSVTETGEVLGTPGFMSPEQLHGRPDIGPAADVYALGGVLYAMFEGRPAFTGDSALEVAMKQLKQHPAQPTVALPGDLWAVILSCLRVDPGDRPKISDVRSALAEQRPMSWVPAAAAASAFAIACIALGPGLLDQGSERQIENRQPSIPSAILAQEPGAFHEVSHSADDQGASPQGEVGCRVGLPAGTAMRTLAPPSVLDSPPSLLVHLPEGHETLGRLPVLVLFHTAFQPPDEFLQASRLLEGAEERGFAVIVPAGEMVLKPWRGTHVRRTVPLLTQAIEELCLDANSVFTYGRGNGGNVAQELTCEGVPTAGGISVGHRRQGAGARLTECRSGPLLLVSYTGDPTEPADGGFGCADAVGGSPSWSIKEQESYLARSRGCSGPSPAEAGEHGMCRDWVCEGTLRTCQAEGGLHWLPKVPGCSLEQESQFDVVREVWPFIDRVRLKLASE